MKRITFGILLCLLIVGILSFCEYVGRVSVQITWLIEGGGPKDHTVEVGPTRFTVPTGKRVTRTHQLRGGGQEIPLLWQHQVWLLPWDGIRLDGRSISPSGLRISDVRGSVRLLGIGRSPSMKVTIQTEDANQASDATSEPAPGADSSSHQR